MSLTFTPMPTPNPNAMKFVANRELAGGAAQTFYSAEAAAAHPLARALFALPGVTGVMLLKEFCTVNKAPDAAWDELIGPATAILARHFGSPA